MACAVTIRPAVFYFLLDRLVGDAVKKSELPTVKKCDYILHKYLDLVCMSQ